MKRSKKIVPEFSVSTRRPRAGFIPGHFSDDDVELFQIWCRSSSGDERRATFGDMSRAGFKPRKGPR